MIPQKLKNSKILLVTHFRTTGFSQILRDWLQNKTELLVYIDHPLPSSLVKNSSMTIFKNGEKQKYIKTPKLLAPNIILFIKDFFLTFYFVFISKQSFFMAIGVDNLNTLALLMLKKIGKIERVVYHTVDFTPNRFPQGFLNSIYHWIDAYCCYNADILWNSSGRMNDGRVKFGMNKNKIQKTIITPDGGNFDSKKRLPITKIDRKKVVFLGHLRERMGLELLLLAFKDVVKKMPDAKLVIIGGGHLLEELKETAKKENITDNVTFTGFIESHKEVDDILRTGAIGVAAFEPVKDSFEYYSDAGKPKVYLAAGLPVVITRVPEIALEIDQKKAGIAIDFDKSKLAAAIVLLLTNDSLYKEYRKNAILLSEKYIWENIFQKAFVETFEHIKNT